MTTLDIRHELVDQMVFAWDYMFLPRMEGLTDEEYRWEPVADVWTVHAGLDGDANWADPNERADPAPFTTIAWRMWHITDMFTRRWVGHFGEGVELETPVALTAAEGMTNLTAAYERWRDALLEMPAEKVAGPTGMAEGEFFKDFPFATLMLHLNREFIHHAAEISLIRDLYRQKDSLRP